MFFRSMSRKDKRQFGGSLIETLMTVGFFGVFAAGFSSMTITQMKAIQSMELRSDIAVLKSTIAGNIDCQRTARAVCGGKPYIYTRTTKMRLPGARQVGGRVPMDDILQHLDTKNRRPAKTLKPQAEPDPTQEKFSVDEGANGVWQVAARCKQASRHTYDIHLYIARRTKDGNEFIHDPLTRQPWTWRDLFKGPICQGYKKR
jgi:hypothetical protein